MRLIQKDNTLQVFAFCFLLSVFILFLDSRGILKFLRISVDKFTIPVQTKLFEVRKTILSPFVLFSDKKSLTERIKTLEEEKASLSEQLANLGALNEENQKMRRLLGSNVSPSWHFEPARVVYTLQDIVYLTSDYKSEAGNAVIIGPASAEEASARQGGVLVGRVQITAGGRIEVLLPTNNNSKIPVIVRDKETGEHKASGIVEGRGGKAMLSQVLSSEQISDGDLVLTSSEGLPPDLLIGYVGRISESRERAWREADIEMAVDPSKLETVFFVTKF